MLNVANIGKRRHVPGRRGGSSRGRGQETVVDAQWVGLVEPAKFYRVKALLTDPSRRKSRPGRVKHLLSLIAECGVCGGPVTRTR